MSNGKVDTTDQDLVLKHLDEMGVPIETVDTRHPFQSDTGEGGYDMPDQNKGYQPVHWSAR